MGIAVPAGFWIATIAFTLFSVAYIEMARRVTTAGGIYSYMSYGFGRIVGMGTAVGITAAYMLFTAGVNRVTVVLRPDEHPRPVGRLRHGLADLRFCFIALMFFITYFHVEVVAKILGIALIGELHHPHDLRLRRGRTRAGARTGSSGRRSTPPRSSAAARVSRGAARVFGVGLAGVGFFACFWSWVGFEMAPNYAEESRNPKKMMAAAIYISCIGLGILYTFWSWMLISAYGSTNDEWVWAVATSYGRGGDTPPISPGNGLPEGNYANVFYPAAQEFAGIGIANIFKVLIITGSFACALAFWQTANRYIFAMGREGILPRVLGRTHAKHKSPFVATIVVGLFLRDDHRALRHRRRRRRTARGGRLRREQPAHGAAADRHVDPVPGQRAAVPAHGRRRSRDHGVLLARGQGRLALVEDVHRAHPGRRRDLLRLLPDDEEPRRHHLRRVHGLGKAFRGSRSASSSAAVRSPSSTGGPLEGALRSGWEVHPRGGLTALLLIV